MCGLAGCWQAGPFADEEGRERVTAMSRCLSHRGPDDEGTFVAGAQGLALGFRRLAILDLSPSGHQPMVSPGGRFVIAFNGEIYNYRDLRAALEARGALFRGTSDTEVLLALVEREGVEAAIARAHGMFAIAVWDAQDRTLWLARDRIGKKPLYFGHVDGTLLFASELKAFARWPGFAPPVDRRALASYLRFGYVPAPHSIYEGIHKVLPGELIACSGRQVTRRVRYWDPRTVAREGRPRRTEPYGDAERVAELDVLLRDAVGRRMIADVPLGAFLSGGIDSSLVVALMQAQSSQPVRTFTIGFDVPGYNEAEHAAAVASHLGTAHTELYVAPAQALDVIPELSSIFDEPFADSSQIPTLLVSRMAREHVTVALSGDGGDELFGGYTRYEWADRVWQRLGGLPLRLRRAGAAALRAAPPRVWDRAYTLGESLLPRGARQSLPGDKMHKLAGILDVARSDDIYRRLVSLWQDPRAVMPAADEYPTAVDDPAHLHASTLGFAERMMLLDAMTYLPDDILVKVDRATMAVSLEGRAPLLDHRVAEWAWRQPLSLKIRAGQKKWVLRQVLYRYVPPSLIERPKMGFGVPLDTWLRGPLRGWAEDLLAPDLLARQGFFDAAAVRRTWDAHQRGVKNEQHRLWAILSFQAWLGRWGHAR